MRINRTIAALGASSFLVGTVLGVSSASQAAPVVTGGVVNVTVTDVADVTLEDVNVGVAAALALAANVCDVNVNVLATQLRDGSATCRNAVDGTTATIDQV